MCYAAYFHKTIPDTEESIMWAQYGWVVWVIFGGLFLYLMLRGGGCCGGHGSSHGGHGRRGSDDPKALDGKTDASTSPNRSRTACH